MEFPYQLDASKLSTLNKVSDIEIVNKRKEININQSLPNKKLRKEANKFYLCNNKCLNKCECIVKAMDNWYISPKKKRIRLMS